MDQEYEKYKDSYSVFWGYLILSNKLSIEEIRFVESNYQKWEEQKIIERSKEW